MEILTIAFAISATLTLLTVLFSGWEVWTHLLYNPEAGIRRYIIRILIMVPIYAVTSYLALTIPEYKVYFETIRDFYEAFALHSFYYFMIEFLGGQAVLAQRLLSHKQQTHHAGGFQLCLSTWKMGPEFVAKNTWGILQYIPCKIFITVMTYVSIIFDFYGEGQYTNPFVAYGYLTVLLTVSQTWALYCLLLFYHGCHEELLPMKPFPKFIAIKAIIFFTFWQSCMISMFSRFGVISESWHIRCEEIHTDPITGATTYEHCWEPAEIGGALNNFIVCLEMLIFTVVHHYAFNIEDFIRMEQEKNHGDPAKHSLKENLVDNFLLTINLFDIRDNIQEAQGPLLTEMQRLALAFDDPTQPLPPVAKAPPAAPVLRRPAESSEPAVTHRSLARQYDLLPQDSL
ncbi:hypothetical protein ACHHYP_10496 [Achlya hypogyna]|uniref:Transmembrane protein n=1 Tax=Achlya hypogyna TaxID=1202772 RepID=A0A1V9YLD8_ACHHY|nr:hypothetical protein ACHHYP_10496 [Achlya hypogyna]